jgi:Phasin protein
MKRRSASEIEAAEKDLSDKVWYVRHRDLKKLVESGNEKIDPKKWEKAKRKAAKIEKHYEEIAKRETRREFAKREAKRELKREAESLGIDQKTLEREWFVERSEELFWEYFNYEEGEWEILLAQLGTLRWVLGDEENTAAALEFVQKLTRAKNWEEVTVIQTEFMSTQLNSLNEQAKSIGDAYTKTAGATTKTPFGMSTWSSELTRCLSYEPLPWNWPNDPNSPFVRDASSKLVRRGYWMDMNGRTLVMVMTQGIGANLTNDEKRAHLIDLKRGHLIDQVCVQEILPPEK